MTRYTTPRRHDAQGPTAAIALALLAVVASWRLATGQGGGGTGWVVTPAAPTVGDTIWVERSVPVPAGWQVRAGKLELGEDVVRDWLHRLRCSDRATSRSVAEAIQTLLNVGPDLGRPLVDRIKGSRIHNLKELRPGSAGTRRR